MKKTGIVILNWNGIALLEKFLPSLVAYTPVYMADIIVADNASNDGSLSFLEKKYPHIKSISFDRNYGFAEGYNRALDSLQYEYVVLLNSDVEVYPKWLENAQNYLDKNPEVVALQPKIMSQKKTTFFEYAGACGGFMDMYGYPFCRGRILNVVERDRGQYNDVRQILWASGACLFIRLKEFKEVGGFDPSFFAHQEEIDLCWRLTARGKKIICLPTSVVFHVGGGTLAMEDPQKTFLNFRNNLLTLYKNLPDRYYNWVMLVRFFMDYLAAFQFLLKGYPANARSVWDARRDFYKKKKEYAPVRCENLSLSPKKLPSLFLRKSLILNFFLLNKKTYRDIISKDE